MELSSQKRSLKLSQACRLWINTIEWHGHFFCSDGGRGKGVWPESSDVRWERKKKKNQLVPWPSFYLLIESPLTLRSWNYVSTSSIGPIPTVCHCWLSFSVKVNKHSTMLNYKLEWSQWYWIKGPSDLNF